MAPVVRGQIKAPGSRFWFGLTIKGYNLLSAESPPVVSMCAELLDHYRIVGGEFRGALGDTTNTRRLTPTIVGFQSLVDFIWGCITRAR